MPFPQAPAGAQWIWHLAAIRLALVLGRSCWWCSRRMTKRSSSAGSGRERRGPVREGYKIVALLLKPSLSLFGLVGRRRVLLPHPGSATGHLIAPGDHHTLQHIQVHFGVDFQADFKDVRWYDVALTWNHTKDHDCSRKLCFHHPVIRGNASPISLVEHYVTFKHDRRLLSLLRFVHNWPTNRWSATKKENRFSLNGNGIMSSFLGRQFYRSTQYSFIFTELNVFTYCNVIPIILFCIVKPFQVFHTNSFICTQLNGFRYCYSTLMIQFNISHLLLHS